MTKGTDFHVQHSPFGAFASFTLGRHGSGGGFGQSIGGPAGQDIYVGWRTAGIDGGPWQLLPFFTGTRVSALAHYVGEEPAVHVEPPPERRGAGRRALAADEFTRRLEWATDTWQAGKFAFRLRTPFEHVADPREYLSSQGGSAREQARHAFAPVVCAELEFDNTLGPAEIELIFGLREPSGPMRALDAPGRLLGFATGTSYGFAAMAEHGRITARQGFELFDPEIFPSDTVHRLGGCSALVFRVRAGERRTFPIALGFYRAGIVSTGISAEFFYTRLFENLEDVLGHGLAHHHAYVQVAEQRDAELRRSHLDDDQQFLLAHATHSYYASTELLVRCDDARPLWVVNEGEYRMMNTLDLTIDHVFFELEWHPWAVRDTLDLFVERYSYRDTLHTARWPGKPFEGGLSFTHDMGVADNFSPPGVSAYECAGLTGCFSHMAGEQLLNWVCCTVCYAEKTRDAEWLARHRQTLLDCAESISRRDHPDPTQRDGLLKFDSLRGGVDGADITTYDSLDISLGQSRNNLYIGVKTLAAWLLLERAFERLGLSADASAATESARRLAGTLETKFDADSGFFPAVFEKGNRSVILPAVEGLVYPLYLGMNGCFSGEHFLHGLLEKLSRHLTHALRPGVCLDQETGTWKISSTSRNTWMSKVALIQHVFHKVFPVNAELMANARHADWQRGTGCASWAYCDQIFCDTGEALGSRYYPRGVTAWLWMTEDQSASA